MSDRLKQYFCVVSNYRKTTDLVKRQTIMQYAVPALLRGTGSERLRLSISRFILEESKDGKQTDQRAS
jgi:hypothetical protein